MTWTARSNVTSSHGTVRRLYCFQIDHTGANLVPPPTSGKIAFVSTKAFLPGATVRHRRRRHALREQRDERRACRVRTRPYSRPTTASAASRVTLAPLYVRPDGIPIATGTTIAAGSALDSGIWQRADGSYVPSTGDLVVHRRASTVRRRHAHVDVQRLDVDGVAGCPHRRAIRFVDPTWWNLATNRRVRPDPRRLLPAAVIPSTGH